MNGTIRRKLGLAVFALLALAATTAPARAAIIPRERHKIRHDRRELRGDRRELRHDRRELGRAVRRCGAHSPQARAEHREL
ncbi:MAG TPA: hypothetical protein VJS92_17265, partial [Candidatus Polarisedimenticolaceae bacterium]|nr:hypothetical protein [Candidatus Polarisedimenticolaceae bacterium]